MSPWLGRLGNHSSCIALCCIVQRPYFCRIKFLNLIRHGRNAMFQLDFTSILQEKTFLCTHDFKQFRHVTQKSSFFRSLLRGGKGRGGWGVIIYQGWRRIDDPPIPSDNVTTPPLGHHMIRYIRYVPKEKRTWRPCCKV